MSNEHPLRGDDTSTDANRSKSTKTVPAQPQAAHRTIGPYRILETLGEGGMGVVYLVEQTKPIHRRLALKLIKPGMDSKAVIARFESERQALALMDHPGVAKVFDAGTTDQGRPYFAMEYVAGVPITEHCDRQKLSILERLKLFMQVCEAVQHAHQKGVIHRDIKPKNILVSVKEGQAVAKVIDFGVAKAISQPLTEKTLFTEQGQLIGTPSYMSPEQAEMTAQDIDTRSDIYSLGVVLYELLTGELPLDPKSLREIAFAQILRMIREVEPSKPSTRLCALKPEPRASARAESGRSETARDESRGSDITTIARDRRTEPKTLSSQLRGDLDWIIMKALEKDRTRRYATASEFAGDIARHLKHEPVIAGPPNAAYRVRKFIRRNRGMVTASAVVFLVLVAGVVGTTSQAVIATRQRNRAVTAEQEQSRARKEAEHARKEAEHQRERAEKARDDLEIVVDFQSSMLSEIDAEQMGRGIFADLREGIREALETKETPADEIDATLASFDETVRGVNSTNLALKVVDERVLTRAVETIEEDFADQPVIRAALRQTVANTYRKIGLYESSMPLQEACLRTRRRVLGDDHPDTLGSIGSMATLRRAMGRTEEALPYYWEALEGKRRILGDDHPSTLMAIDNVGTVLKSMGKLAEAELYVREALERYRRVLGNDHPDTLTSINNMGGLLESMGKLAEAEPYYREALEARRVLGDDHPGTLISINNMGGLLESMGKLAEAEPYYREALEGHRRVLGDEHPRTLTSIANMGGLLQSMGKLAEAEPYMREALEARRRVLGDDHPDTLTSINNMGSLLYTMGKLAETEPYSREALEGRRRLLGDDHPRTLRAIGNMGILLRSMGKLDEAGPYYREALEGHRRVLGDEHPNTLASIANMGGLLQSMGKLAEAEPYIREALEGRRRVLGDDHPDTLTSINDMADLRREQGRLPEAESLHRESLEGARRKLPDGHWRTGTYLLSCGKTLTQLERYAEAEAALLEAHETLEAARGPEHERTIKTINYLVDLYETWAAAEPNQGYAEKAAQWRGKLPEENSE